MKWTKFFLFCSLFFVSACSITNTETGKAAHDFYFKYVNNVTELDLNDADSLKDIETELSSKFALLDKELSDLARTLEATLDPTNRNAVIAILNKFPWISNVYIINSESEIAGALPPSVPAHVEFSYLNSFDGPKSRELYGHILHDYDNRTFLIARPYIKNKELIGYLAVSFDVESLLPLIGDSSNIFIRTPEDLLYSGDYFNVVESTTVEQWQRQVDLRSVSGRRLENEQAAWIVRYYANLPLLFGVVSEIKSKSDSEYEDLDAIESEEENEE